jgi:hypothetical protein
LVSVLVVSVLSSVAVNACRIRNARSASGVIHSGGCNSHRPQYGCHDHDCLQWSATRGCIVCAHRSGVHWGRWMEVEQSPPGSSSPLPPSDTMQHTSSQHTSA